MRRIPVILLLVAAGCSTAPVADFLDLAAPGGPSRPDHQDVGPLPPRLPIEALPPPLERPPDDRPPLPPVPAGYTPRSSAPEPPAARLVPQPTR